MGPQSEQAREARPFGPEAGAMLVLSRGSSLGAQPEEECLGLFRQDCQRRRPSPAGGRRQGPGHCRHPSSFRGAPSARAWAWAPHPHCTPAPRPRLPGPVVSGGAWHSWSLTGALTCVWSSPHENVGCRGAGTDRPPGSPLTSWLLVGALSRSGGRVNE